MTIDYYQWLSQKKGGLIRGPLIRDGSEVPIKDEVKSVVTGNSI